MQPNLTENKKSTQNKVLNWVYLIKELNLFYLGLFKHSETLKKTKTVKGKPKTTNTKAVSKEDWLVTKVVWW